MRRTFPLAAALAATLALSACGGSGAGNPGAAPPAQAPSAASSTADIIAYVQTAGETSGNAEATTWTSPFYRGTQRGEAAYTEVAGGSGLTEYRLGNQVAYGIHDGQAGNVKAPSGTYVGDLTVSYRTNGGDMQLARGDMAFQLNAANGDLQGAGLAGNAQNSIEIATDLKLQQGAFRGGSDVTLRDGSGMLLGEHKGTIRGIAAGQGSTDALIGTVGADGAGFNMSGGFVAIRD